MPGQTMRAAVLRAYGQTPANPRPWIAIACVLLLAINLRPSITAVGPVVGEIRADTGASAGVAGLLTTLPVLAFAAVSTCAAGLGRRLGLERVMVVAMLVLALGTAVRLPGSLPILFVGTALIGAAIGIVNVLLPAVVKRDHGRSYGPVTAAYSSALVAFAALGAGLSVPVANWLGDWRIALALWGLPALGAAIIWVPRALGADSRERSLESIGSLGASLRRSPVAWAVTGFFGLQAFGFYASVAWFPEIVNDRGATAGTAGWMFALSQLVGVGATFLAPLACSRLGGERGPVWATGVALSAGWLGLLTAGSGALVLWAALIGAGQGAGLGLGLLFMGLRARDARASAALSGMAQAYGYLIAATAPLLAGALHDLTARWGTAIILLVLVGFAQTAIGLSVSSGRGRDAPAPVG